MLQRCLGVTAVVCVLGAAVPAQAQEAAPAADLAAKIAEVDRHLAAALANGETNPDMNQLWGARNILEKCAAQNGWKNPEVLWRLAKTNYYLAPGTNPDVARGMICPEGMKAGETCVALDPEHPEAWYWLGRMHMHPYWGRNFDMAAQAFQRDLDLSAQRQDGHRRLTLCLLNQNKHAPALAAADAGLAVFAEDAVLHERRGDALYGLKKFAEAKPAYATSADLDPSNYPVIDKWINADLLWQQQTNPQGMDPYPAIKWLRAFDTRHPQHWKAGEKAAELYLLQMWPGVWGSQGAEKAVPFAQEGLNLLWDLERRFSSNIRYAYWAKLECPVHRSYQQYDKLADAVARAVQADRSYDSITVVMRELTNAARTMNLFDEYRSTRQWARCIALVDQLLAVLPGATEKEQARRGVLHQVHFECYQPLNEYEKAEQAIKAAIAANPRNAVYPNSYGLMLRYLGRRDDAETQFRASLEIEADHPWSSTNLATLLLETGQWDKFNAHMAAVLEFSRQAVETAVGKRAQLNDDPEATAETRAVAKENALNARFHAANLRRLYIEGLRLQRLEAAAAKTK